MAKDPAVLFYTSDFLTGTLTMSDEQVGKYIKLLCLQHQKGLLTEKDMLNICKSYDEDIWFKFVKTDEGYYNKRMKEEADKRRNYSESRRKNKIKGKKTEHMLNISSSHDEHMENEDAIKDVIKDVIKEGVIGGERKPPTLETIEYYFIQQGGTKKMALHFFNKHSATGWRTHSGPITHFIPLITNFINNWRDNEKLKRNSKDAWKLDGSPDIEYDPL